MDWVETEGGGAARLKRRLQGHRRVEEFGECLRFAGAGRATRGANYAFELLEGTLSERFERGKAARIEQGIKSCRAFCP